MKNKVTISGTALLATIATMDSLGPIGKEVLRENGIKKIIENKEYPYELRNNIHKAVLNRYGEIAIFSMGYKNSELLYDLMSKPMIKFATKETIGMSSKNISKNKTSLKNVFTFFSKKNGDIIKKLTKGVDIEYGNKIDQLDDYSWRLKCTMALELFSEPFIRGVHESQLIETLGKYFEINRTYEPKLSNSGYGYATWSYKYTFMPRVLKLSGKELLNQSRNNIHDKLMRVVLKDSFLQNKKIKEISTQISKYIPPQINEQFLKGNYTSQISTKRKKLTIFFSDIKNFTATSENLQPEDLTKYLNEYFSEMTAIALKYGATIDKYIGDAMMLFFGDPESHGVEEDAKACLKMALAMQERMKILQEKWKKQGFAEPFQVRIGINTGYCNVGNFGSDQRLSYTIIGGEVNIAQRLEGNADANGILMSYETYALTQDLVDVEERENLSLKGINRIVKCFAIKERKSVKYLKNLQKKIHSKINTNNAIVKESSLEKRLLKIEKNIDLLTKKLNQTNKRKI